MFRIVLLFACFASLASADIQWVRFSFQFGSSDLDFNGTETDGFGYSATSEIFMAKKWGYIANVGSATTDVNDVNIDGQTVKNLEVRNRFAQAGGFYFPLDNLRLAAGPGFHFVNYEIQTYNSSSEDSANFIGPFASINYRLPIETFTLGAQYSYASFGDYSQSDLYLMLGAAF